MHKLVLVMIALGVVLVGCNQVAPVEHQDKQSAEKVEKAQKQILKAQAQISKAQNQKADPAKEDLMTPQEKVDAFCDDDVPMYKQSAKCTNAILEARAPADKKFEEEQQKPYTVERFQKADDNTSSALLNCQLEKYADDYGERAAIDHAEEILNGLLLSEYQHPKDKYDKIIKKQLEKSGAEPIYAEKGHDTVQAQLIDEGYTCSENEMM